MKRVAMVVAVMALAGCRHAPPPEVTGRYQGRALFTCCNIHYESDEVSDANYYVGSTVPFGTPVTVENVTAHSVTFVAEGTKITLLHRYGQEQESMQQYFDKMLLAEDPKPRVAGLAQSVQDAIREARVEQGMTREQVITALGYPATHKTPSTAAREWTYWFNRWVTYKVAFDESGRVTNVIGRPAPTRDQPIKEDAPPPPPSKGTKPKAGKP